MRRQHGFTLIEMLTVMAVSGILLSISIPSVTGIRRVVGDSAGARKLALVLRAAQAKAQAHQSVVRVTVQPDGHYSVTETQASGASPDGVDSAVARGELGAGVSTNYAAGTVEFGPRGWPLAPGSLTPRAGTFTVGDDHRVVIQLGGCVRCL